MTTVRAGTVRRTRASGARRLLSLWSDAALDEVEGRSARAATSTTRSSTTRSSARRSPAPRSPASRSSASRSSGSGSSRAKPRTASSAPATRSRSGAGAGTGATTTGSARGRPPSSRSPSTRSGGTTSPKAGGSRPTSARRPAGDRSGPSSERGRSTGARSGTSRAAGTRSARTRTGAGPSPTARSGPNRSAPAGAPSKRTGSTRAAGTRSGGGSGPARRGASARQRSRAEAPAGFRARRSKPQAKRSRRKSHPPVTEVGERTAAYLTATVLGLTLFGLVMVLSASSVSSLHQLADSPFFQFKRQAMWAGLGAVAFVVASRIDYRRLRPLAGPMLALTIAMLVALLIPGVGLTENGSTRWLGVGPLVIQPSEVAKLVLIVFVADLLARRERRMDRPELTVRPVMLVLVLVSGLIVVQPKLGTPIILSAVTLLMLFVAGARLRSLASWVSVAVVAAGILAYVADYRRKRLLAFLDPWTDPLGIGLQSIQSQVGIASGGLYGVGLGAGRAKWGFLPEAQSDFIFAIVAEEVGLIGASALIGGFLLICWFGLRTAVAAPDRFGTLLAAGITSWLLVQAFLNIGMVLGVLPITGEALPFVSAGGSSLVVTLAAAGLLTSVARRVRG